MTDEKIKVKSDRLIWPLQFDIITLILMFWLLSFSFFIFLHRYNRPFFCAVALIVYLKLCYANPMLLVFTLTWGVNCVIMMCFFVCMYVLFSYLVYVCMFHSALSKCRNMHISYIYWYKEHKASNPRKTAFIK